MAWNSNPAYQPGQKGTHKLSRSKIDLFVECPRCFWLAERLKIRRPDTPPFQINKAIDELLKKEFDSYRKKGQPHPWMVEIGLAAVPFAHDRLDDWRHNFTGVQVLYEPANLLITGAVDDIWVTTDDELIVVDYKATAKDKDITDLDPPGGWHDAYRRQMEVYQWLLRRNGFKVSDIGYFVYANGQLREKAFKNSVKFVTRVFPYKGNDEWVEPTLIKIKQCLESDMPAMGSGQLGQGCGYCSYTEQRLRLAFTELKKREMFKHQAK